MANVADKPQPPTGDEKKNEKVPSPWSVLWPAYLCSFVDFLGFGVAIPILPFFTMELGWITNDPKCPKACPEPGPFVNGTYNRCGRIPECGTAVDYGLLQSIFAVGQFFGGVIFGKLSDKYGRKVCVMVSLFGSSLGYGWCGLAPNLTHLYLARLWSGLFGGTQPVVSAMILDTVSPRERPKYFGIAGAMIGVAFVFGPALGGLVAAILTKRAAFFAPTVVAMIVQCVAWFNVKETSKNGGICGAQDPAIEAIKRKVPVAIIIEEIKLKAAKLDTEEGRLEAAAAAAAAAKNTQNGNKPEKPKLPTVIYALCFCYFLHWFSFSQMTAMFAMVWMALFNTGTTAVAIFLTIAGVWGIFNQAVSVKQSVKWLGPEKVIIISSLMGCIGQAGWTFIDIDWLHYVYFMIFISFSNSFQMAILSTLLGRSCPPQIRGLATGLLNAGGTVGKAIAPIVAGPLFMSDVLAIKHKCKFKLFIPHIYTIFRKSF